MKLGDFRKLTDNLSDDTDIIIWQWIEGEREYITFLENVKIEKNENIYNGECFSNPVVYIDKQPGI